MTDAVLPLFYKTPRVLQPDLHSGLSLALTGDCKFAAGTNTVPLGLDEVASASRHFPVVFSDAPASHPLAVLGLRDQQNLFINAEGHWATAVYVPAYIRRYPFIFMENEGRPELTLCIDDSAPMVVKGRENPFFETNGEPTQLTRSALAFCGDFQQQYQGASEFGRAMAEAGLLIDHRADVTLRSGEALSLAGFKVIDGERFSKLPDDVFLAWRRNGWLPLVYAHFFSVGAWSSLIELSSKVA